MKCSVLLLGAGFVARPTLDILVEGGVEVTVGKLPICEL
jgi:saccharopine dehydrogenase-like NADP-dependent oxidoreductase